MIVCAAPLEAQQATDDERPPVPKPQADEPCDQGQRLGLQFESCSTPREGFLSGVYGALDLGIMALDAEAEARVGAGPGVSLQLRFGIEFWDHVLAALAFGSLWPNDRRPFSELVVDCTEINGVNVGCSDDPHEQSSSVSATFLGFEIGVQRRFRPAQSVSLTPGLLLGGSTDLGGLTRAVDCDGCREVRLDADVAGWYLGPFFRVTFGKMGAVAAILRAQWFLTGDLMHVSTLGIEAGLP